MREIENRERKNSQREQRLAMEREELDRAREAHREQDRLQQQQLMQTMVSIPLSSPAHAAVGGFPLAYPPVGPYGLGPSLLGGAYGAGAGYGAGYAAAPQFGIAPQDHAHQAQQQYHHQQMMIAAASTRRLLPSATGDGTAGNPKGVGRGNG